MLNENAIVEKSKEFIWSKFSSWNAGELAIFDTYLSRINARDSSSAEVVFTKREYEQLMGLKEVRPEQLNRYVRSFIRNGVSIKTDRGWVNYPLFFRATCEKNDNGEWEVRMRCHPDLEDKFFALAESGYQTYRLKYTLGLKSKYSKLLYCLLKDNAYRGEWVADLKELRELIGATEASWESFKEFNRRILKVAEEEINNNTDIRFTYEKVQKGRLTRAIRFKIKTVASNTDVLPGQMDVYDYPELLPDPEPEDPMMRQNKFWKEACDDEFSIDQIKELVLLANPHVEHSEVKPHDVMVYDYLRVKYVSLANKKDIKSRFGYMKYLVENNC